MNDKWHRGLCPHARPSWAWASLLEPGHEASLLHTRLVYLVFYSVVNCMQVGKYPELSYNSSQCSTKYCPYCATRTSFLKTPFQFWNVIIKIDNHIHSQTLGVSPNQHKTLRYYKAILLLLINYTSCIHCLLCYKLNALPHELCCSLAYIICTHLV
jgi:hypothetical protein